MEEADKALTFHLSNESSGRKAVQTSQHLHGVPAEQCKVTRGAELKAKEPC